MEKILIPIDGSDSAARALQFLVKRMLAGMKADVYLINVQAPIRLNAEPAFTAESIQKMQEAAGEETLQAARTVLDTAGVLYKTKVAIGEVAPSIAQYAKEQNCSAIIMGTRGMGSVGNLILGSVATKVMHLVDIPVTFIK
jgi:nucleotide-binding universal stress UspA family protein